MRVRTKDGKTVEVSGSYGLRLIEQGKAVAAPGGRTPAEGTTTGGTATAGREGTLPKGSGTQDGGVKSANAYGGRTSPRKEPMIYTCSAGETFDGVALAVYGDERYAPELLNANPTLCHLLRFQGGEVLTAPTIEIREGQLVADTTPPWRR